MDFLDPAKKRAHGKRLVLGYVLITIIVGLATWLLVLLSRGYNYDTHTGKVKQNGLVFVSSHPVSAGVFVDGVHKGDTTIKLNIPSGEYSIEIKQTGYRTWHRTISLDGGQVIQMNYPLLFPTKLASTDTQLFAKAPVMSSQSIDRRWLVVEPNDQNNNLDLFDLSSKTIVLNTIKLPNSIFLKPNLTGAYEPIEWSNDNHHLLIKHNFKGGYEFIVLDVTDPAKSYNVNQVFKVNPSSVTLRGNHYDRVYLYDAKTLTLSTADLGTRTAQTAINKVLSFEVLGTNEVIYLTNNLIQKNQVAVYIWDTHNNYLIHNYPATSDYLLESANFNGNEYLVVGQKTTGEAYIYKNALSQAKTKKNADAFKTLKLKHIDNELFSLNGQFLELQNGHSFATYDIDADNRYYYQLSPTIKNVTKALWMDGFHMQLVADNKTTVFDFDGSNRQSLSASSNLSPGFSPDFTELYNIAPSNVVPGRYSLTQTYLKTK